MHEYETIDAFETDFHKMSLKRLIELICWMRDAIRYYGWALALDNIERYFGSIPDYERAERIYLELSN